MADRPKINLGFGSTGAAPKPPPAPLMDPEDPEYVRAGCEYLIDKWRKEAEKLDQQIKQLEDGQHEWIDDLAERVLRYRVGAHCLRCDAWLLECVVAGRMEDVARGRISFPQDPKQTPDDPGGSQAGR